MAAKSCGCVVVNILDALAQIGTGKDVGRSKTGHSFRLRFDGRERWEFTLDAFGLDIAVVARWANIVSA